MSDVFDTEALRQAATMPFPAGDFKRQAQLWAQMASDLDAAADYIDELAAERDEAVVLGERLAALLAKEDTA